MLKFLDFLFPPTCPICDESVASIGQICAKCWNEFDWIGAPKCKKCGYPFPANIDRGENMLCPDCIGTKSKLDWMRSASVYDGASRNVMLGFKHASRLEYKNMMSRAMIPLLRELPTINPSSPRRRGSAAPQAIDIIIPVPLANRRLWRRGYNQAALLAKPLAKHLGAKMDYDGVERKYRPDMGHKNAKSRKRNIAGVFKIRKPENIKGERILLVDDVYTTGATFEELAKTLKRAGAIWVGGLTFCRTVRAI